MTDTGSGIDAKEVDKIFDRFYQTEQMDSLTTGVGTGIGLALTKGIVELHHGTIKVESELGKGSSFIVRLHLGNAHFNTEEISKKSEDVQQIEQPQISEIDASLKAELEENAPIKRMPDVKMVIVEDNASICEMLANIFRPFYQVLTAADGEEGLELIQKEMPNIVVSDVVMPKMSGTELCKQIKNDFNTCHIPVVLLTARTAVEQNIEGLRIGADDYITKPFNTNLLISKAVMPIISLVLPEEVVFVCPLISVVFSFGGIAVIQFVQCGFFPVLDMVMSKLFSRYHILLLLLSSSRMDMILLWIPSSTALRALHCRDRIAVYRYEFLRTTVLCCPHYSTR